MNGRIIPILGVRVLGTPRIGVNLNWGGRGSEPPGSGVHDEREDHPDPGGSGFGYPQDRGNHDYDDDYYYYYYYYDRDVPTHCVQKGGWGVGVLVPGGGGSGGLAICGGRWKRRRGGDDDGVVSLRAPPLSTTHCVTLPLLAGAPQEWERQRSKCNPHHSPKSPT